MSYEHKPSPGDLQLKINIKSEDLAKLQIKAENKNLTVEEYVQNCVIESIIEKNNYMAKN